MSELKVCRICLRTESKVYNYEQFQLKYYYEEILALKISEMDELPQYFCFECATLLHKYHKFKEKCLSGQKLLKDMLKKGPAGIKELSKFSAKMIPQESEVNNPFLETNINLQSLPVLTDAFDSTDPVEIDSFFINNLNVVLEEDLNDNARMLNICSDTHNSNMFQEPNVSTKENLSKNNNEDSNFAKLADNDPIPIVICDLPTANETLLETDLRYEEIDSNLTQNLEGLEDDDASMLYGDLPSISQVFDESNIDYIESLSTNNNIDNVSSDLPNSTQQPIIEFIYVSKKNNVDINIETVENEPPKSYLDLVQDNLSPSLNSQENNTELSETNVQESLINESVPVVECTSAELLDANLAQAESEFVDKNELEQSKVKITTKNQVAPNIHSILPTTSKEYFETVPDSDTGDIDSEDSLNQLQVEQADTEGVKLKVPQHKPVPDTNLRACKKRRSKKIRRKYPFNKKVQPSPCHKKCGNNCSGRLSGIDRQIIHDRYWKMDKKKQQDWLLTCIRPKKIRRRQGTTSIKNISYEYHIAHEGEEIKVCQQFLLKTLDVSQMRFRYAISKHNTNVDNDLQ